MGLSLTKLYVRLETVEEKEERKYSMMWAKFRPVLLAFQKGLHKANKVLTRSRKEENKRDWAELNIELLHLISKKMESLSNFIIFRAVCKNWRLATDLTDAPAQLPWLIWPTATTTMPIDRSQQIRDNGYFVYSLSSNTTQRIPLPNLVLPTETMKYEFVRFQPPETIKHISIVLPEPAAFGYYKGRLFWSLAIPRVTWVYDASTGTKTSIEIPHPGEEVNFNFLINDMGDLLGVMMSFIDVVGLGEVSWKFEFEVYRLEHTDDFDCYRWSKLNEIGDRIIFLQDFNYALNNVKVFSFNELKIATNNFSRDSLLGCGAFGIVYGGQLSDGRLVAVKLCYTTDSGWESCFKAELETLATTCHVNVVSLIGYCKESNEPLCVFEYMPNKDLHRHIHLRNWRMKCDHVDVATVIGTAGYLDPDCDPYFPCVTQQNDVYSFGVVMLEMVTGRRAYNTSDETQLAPFAAPKIARGKLMEVLDKRLAVPVGRKMEAVQILAQLALQCTQSGLERPNMSEVVTILESAVALFN
ncbi:putative Kinase [Carex littledalei]|uniref:Putative Kinase n=1 Tax=Carex littledalei TaxID=544730 RepID=A0A833VQT9_9POAL|nr:putative Kinase [Carex littledalei]